MSLAKPYWRTIPPRAVIIFLLGVFLLFGTIGFTTDLMEMGRQSTLSLVLSVLGYGAFAIVYAAAGFVLQGKSWMAIVPIFIVQNVAMGLLGHFLPAGPQPVELGAVEIAQIHHRLNLSGVANIAAMMLGYGCFVFVSVTEGRRYFRVHAEMELAAEIHHVLVPAIAARVSDFEFYGRSLPSSEVGGDLIDLVQDDQGWIAYIADVSGHGVAPGVVMGMVKSAARMRLSFRKPEVGLLESLNSVLYPITKPEMFVTFAYLAWNGERLEYSLAGHPAILHYHAATGQISEVACSNLPLGMFDGQSFVTGTVGCAPEDLFLLLTDGLLEVTDKQGDELGLEGVKAVISEHGGDPLDAISQALLAGARAHGQAADDQSLLLVRSHVRRLSPAGTAGATSGFRG
jgi:stage II sporulation SpoE-like protein